MKISCICDRQSPRGKCLPPPPPSQNSLQEALELGMEPGRPAPSQVDLPMSTGRHQRGRISRRSDDNDSWMRTGSGRRGGGGEHGWTRTGRRGSWRTRMSGGWPPARPAPPLTLDRVHPADSETVPCWGAAALQYAGTSPRTVRRELLG